MIELLLTVGIMTVSGIAAYVLTLPMTYFLSKVARNQNKKFIKPTNPN
ncbi:MAG: hypothetical protein WDN75_17435 [Bacteroidota bacterium]